MITYIGPLAMVIMLSLMKEIYDECKRAAKDREYNSQKYAILTPKGELEVSSGQLKVGNIVKLTKDRRVPADCVLLWTSDESGACFLKTDQLDGETDWKCREPVHFTQNIMSKDEMSIFNHKAFVECSGPSNLIYEFNGVFYSDTTGENFESLRLKNTLWSNTVVASGEAWGLVLYSGKETRIQMGIKNASTKFGQIDHEINFLSKQLFVFAICMSVICLLLSGININGDWYITLFRYILQLSSIIPISMRVNIDFAKLVYSMRINKDVELPGCLVRNSSIPEELGRIEHLLCDKTGTLTQNVMIFKQICSNLGNFNKESENELIDYIRRNIEKSPTTCSEYPVQGKKDKFAVFRDQVTALMICHNVTPTVENNERDLKAASPDEIALVKYSEYLGYYLDVRTGSKIEITNLCNKKERYQILHNFPFSSERRRMGILVKDLESGKYIFYQKGADSVIKTRVNHLDRNFIEEECESLAREGQRTLCIAQKVLTEDEYLTWAEEMKQAGKEFRTRDELEEKCIEKLEASVDFQGITGVEDLLQDKIKEVIQTLKDAGIKVWMITGDKLETAKCIAVATGLKKNTEKFFEVKDFSNETEFKFRIEEFERNPTDVMVIEGNTLEKVIPEKTTRSNSHLKDMFLKAAAQAPSVICCRCSPNQKESITKGLKDLLKKGVACIGDGGNDVGMIQSAHVGIGIEGKEGKQAALASDFSIQEYKDIQKLLLWHGRLSYIRTALLVNFIIHRGLIISVIQLLFTVTYYYVSIQIYNGYLMLGYATLFTNFPIFAQIFIEDVNLDQAYDYPVLYKLLSKGRETSFKTFLVWTWKSIYQAAVIMLCSLQFFDNSFLEIVTITFTSQILIEMLNVASEIRNYHPIIVGSQIASVVLYLFCLLVLPKVFLLSNITASVIAKVCGIVAISWVPFKIYDFIQFWQFPSTKDKIRKEAREKAKRNKNQDYSDQQS